MKMLSLTYLNGERVLVNQFSIRIVTETESQTHGMCSLISFNGTTNQCLVKESIDEIQLQLDDKGDVSVTIKQQVYKNDSEILQK